ncbi:MAG: hypothetical protein ACRDL5_07720 [Solirubrobacteraceae bacterium]
MPQKRLLRPQRLRRVPAQFSWIDQRLVRERHTERCGAEALALYLVLVTVADASGLSYYGDASLMRVLSMPAERLRQARGELIRLDLIAFERPLYQVLSLDAPEATRVHGVQSLEPELARLRARLRADRPDRQPLP